MKKLYIMSISVICMTLLLLFFTSFITITYNKSTNQELNTSQRDDQVTKNNTTSAHNAISPDLKESTYVTISSKTNYELIIIIFILECLILLLLIFYQITTNKRNTKLILEQEKYNIVLNQSLGVIWEYDIKSDTLKKSNKNGGFYYGSDYIENYISYSIENEIIYPEDINQYNEFCHHLKTGKEEIRSMFRAKDMYGDYVWFEIIGITLFENNNPITVIGTTINIDTRQKEYQKLKQHAEQDPLTKLYNRVAAEAKINHVIETSEFNHMHAFCMIDIDNFKSLNDNLGHTFGDTVLIKFSSRLNNLLSDNDFAFRIGGDEFAVFLNNIPSSEYAENVSKEICSIFNELLLENSNPCDISGSIGISLYPNHGTSFDELFTMADIALYHSKDLGKDCYSLYSKKTMGEFTIESEEHNEAKSRESHILFDNSLLSNVIDVLFDSKDLSFTINFILSLIGNYYNIDSLGICEYTSDYKTIINTYKWHAQDSKDFTDPLCEVSKEEAEHYAYYKTTKTGVYYCRELHTLDCKSPVFIESLKNRDIQSFIQCAIVDSGNYTGYIYANIGKNKRQLEKHEIDTLFFISKIIGGYIRKLRSEEIARVIARKDLLTDSYNINSFSEEANSILLDNQYDRFVILNFDINKFKQINETFGYSHGDELLIDIAKMFKRTLTTNELFGRIIGDRFLVLLHYDTLEDLQNRIQYYLMQFNTLPCKQNDGFNVSLIIGIYLIEPNDQITIAVDRANIARKSIRERHRNNYAYFNTNMKASIIKRQSIENIMVASLAHHEFCVYYQPKFNLITGEICGAEALIRWQRQNCIIYPNDFIPIFEENGFITEIDFFVFEEVCKQLRKLIDQHNKVVPISVNFSRFHFSDNKLLPHLVTLLDRYKISPDLIEIEITESAMTDNNSYLLPILEQIRQLGLRLSMDDFGSGLSSLNALRALPFDILKLDKNFFCTETTTIKERIVVSNIVNMARELQLEIISEGVETEEQATFLKSIGCEYAQGYLFAKPMPANEYIEIYLMD